MKGRNFVFVLAAVAAWLFYFTSAFAVPLTCTVTSTADAGAGTLRNCIATTNTNANPADTDIINFDASLDGSTITLSSALPALTEKASVTTLLNITVDGVNKSFTCFELAASFSDIVRLSIVRCDIGVKSSAGNTAVRFCNIGTNSASASGLGNNIGIDGATAVDQNVISGNVVGANGGGYIYGSKIGTNVAGTAALPNGTGVVVTVSDHCLGDDDDIWPCDADAPRNIISGNVIGVDVQVNSGTVPILNNYIGTDITGTQAIPNGTGIKVTGSSTGIQIGNGTAPWRNVISGNTNYGIHLTGSSVTIVLIQGNYIGTDNTGNAALGNGVGIFIDGGANQNVIGGASLSNVISGNVTAGVKISGATTTLNSVKGNYIGVKADASGTLSNGDGILIDTGARDNTIGGTVVADRNIISGNTNGIHINGAGGTAGTCVPNGNFVVGNYIGTNPAGGASMQNTTGVLMDGGSDCNEIGGDTAGERNLISGNLTGVEISGSGTDNNKVMGNYIGPDAAGTADLGTQNIGVLIQTAAKNNRIGGLVVGERNVISGNNSFNIRVKDTGTDSNKIQGNFIGPDNTGNAALTGVVQGVGIQLDNTAQYTLIGYQDATGRNVISGNTNEGIKIDGANTKYNQIKFNKIGIQNAGPPASLPNGNLVIATLVNGAPGEPPDKWCQNDYWDGAAQNDGTCNIVVLNNSDSGAGSLRQAILDANSTPGDDTIVFDAGVFGQTITLLSAFPSIVDTSGTLTIDGVGSNVRVDGVNKTFAGFTINDSNVVIKGLTITRFLVGISIANTTSTNVQIFGNIIGTDNADTGGLGNTTGVQISAGATLNIIGGDIVAERNIISGNTTGVKIVKTIDANPVTGNKVIGNYIGTNGAGGAALANTTGVEISGGAAGNFIGFTNAGEGNVISGNTTGITITGSGTNSNQVLQNLLGTNAGGVAAVANTTGISILASAQSNIIGGDVAAERNVISGNTTVGIQISGANTKLNTVLGNYIGLNSAGGAAIANGIGVKIESAAQDNDIGGQNVGEGNVISGNTNEGVLITGASTTGNELMANYIGLNAAGAAAIANGTGVKIELTASTNTIGGNVAAKRNVISGNTNQGILITGAGTNSNVVIGNYIGLRNDGLAAIGNGTGIEISGGVTAVTIGGTTAGDRNAISGNTTGVLIDGAATTGVTFQGNYVGLAGDGSGTLGNTGNGVVIQNGVDNVTIGGTAAGAGNVISGNNNGVVIKDAGTDNNVLYGNLIGTNPAGTGDFGNTTSGVEISGGAKNNVIGGGTAGKRNVISGNNGQGVLITGAGTDFNVVTGNYIGTRADGAAALANGKGVVIIAGAINNKVGGLTEAMDKNVISGNTTNGVELDGAATTTNRVERNYIGVDATASFSIQNDAKVNEADQINGSAGNYICANKYWNGIIVATGPVCIIFVENNSDSGLGSLREAINTTNSQAGADTIQFYVANLTIIPASALPALNDTTGGTTIDGTGKNPTLDGNGANFDGLQLTSSNNTVKGLTIIRFSGSGKAGIKISDTLPTNNVLVTGNVVSGNYIGTDSLSTAGRGNNIGVLITTTGATEPDANDGTKSTTIGGVIAADRNIISGNLNYGVQISGTESDSNNIYGNYIGTKVDGLTALANGTGVFIGSGAQSNNVGGAVAGQQNVISGNTNNGVLISGTGTNSNVVKGNLIGTTKDGNVALGNGTGLGILAGAQSNTVGGMAANEANVIASSTNQGVYISGTTTSSNTIDKNFIGIDAGQTVTLIGNNKDGVWLENFGPVANTLTNAIIRYNKESGVQCSGCSTSSITNNTIQNSTLEGILIDVYFGGDARHDTDSTAGSSTDVFSNPTITGNNVGTAGQTNGGKSVYVVDNLIAGVPGPTFAGLNPTNTLADVLKVQNDFLGFVQVQNGNGNAVNGATVTVKDGSGATIPSGSGSTDTCGYYPAQAAGLSCPPEGDTDSACETTDLEEKVANDGAPNVHFGGDTGFHCASLIDNSEKVTGTPDADGDSNCELTDTEEVVFNDGATNVHFGGDTGLHCTTLTINTEQASGSKLNAASGLKIPYEKDGVNQGPRWTIEATFGNNLLKQFFTFNADNADLDANDFSSPDERFQLAAVGKDRGDLLIKNADADTDSTCELTDGEETVTIDGTINVHFGGDTGFHCGSTSNNNESKTFNFSNETYDTGPPAVTVNSDGTYNETGTDQNISKKGNSIYHIQVQNDDTVSQIYILTGTPTDANWDIKYYDAITGGVDITAAVTGAGYSTGAIAAGGTKDLRVEVKQLLTGAPNKDITLTMTLDDPGDAPLGALDIRKDFVKTTTKPLDNFKVVSVPTALEPNNDTTLLIAAKDADSTTLFTYANTANINLTQNGTGGAAEVVWSGTGVADTGTAATLAAGNFATGVTSAKLNYTVPAGPITITVTEADFGGKTGNTTTTTTNVTWSSPGQINVTNNNDSGAGSLRQAILDANSTNGANTIIFTISGVTISPTTALPALDDITGGTTIEGTGKNIRLDGTSCTNCDGVVLQSDNNTVKGLSIIRFTGTGKAGIKITGNINTVKGCYVGTDFGESPAIGNYYGVLITGSTGAPSTNTVGGALAADKNIISGNTAHGVSVLGTTSLKPDGNTIQGNNIGVKSDGATALGNGQSGVYVTIAGSTTVTSNIIRYNDEAGVLSSKTSTLYTGLGADGTISTNTIQNNGQDGTATRGEGIYNEGASPAITGNTITNNRLDGILNVVFFNGDSFSNTDSMAGSNKDILSTPTITGNTINSNASGISVHSIDNVPVLDFAVINPANTLSDAVRVQHDFYGFVRVLDGSGNGKVGASFTLKDVFNTTIVSNVTSTNGYFPGQTSAAKVDANNSIKIVAYKDGVSQGPFTVNATFSDTNMTQRFTFDGDSGDLDPSDQASPDKRFQQVILGKDRPDIQVKNKTDAGYTGNGVYNLTGTAQSLASGVSIYHFKIENDATAAQNYTVTGTAGDGNWDIKYFDLEVGGADITVNITGAGYPIVGLAAGGNKVLRAEVRFIGAATPQNKTVTLTVTESVDVNKQDISSAATFTLDHFSVTANPTILAPASASTITVVAQDASNNTLLTYGNTALINLTQSGTGGAADVIWGGAGVTDGGTTGTLASGNFTDGQAAIQLTYALSAGPITATVTETDLGGKTGNTTLSSTNITWVVAIEVTNANDSGAGSLRQAITTANASPGTDLITFTISNSTITPASALPALSDTVGGTLVDGTGQSIKIDGSSCSGCDGFVLSSANNIIKGLTIIKFNSAGKAGIKISGATATNNAVTGNYIGTDSLSTSGLGNAYGVLIEGGAQNNTVGGNTAALRNIISGNASHGVYIKDSATNNNSVKGNYIGTNVGGTAALANTGSGVFVSVGPSTTTVGGAVAADGNKISFNGENGVTVQGATGVTVGFNTIASNTKSGIELSPDYGGDTYSDTIGGDVMPTFTITNNSIDSNCQSVTTPCGGISGKDLNSLLDFAALSGANVLGNTSPQTTKVMQVRLGFVRVLDAGGTPVSVATVTVKDKNDATVSSGATDANGFYPSQDFAAKRNANQGILISSYKDGITQGPFKVSVPFSGNVLVQSFTFDGSSADLDSNDAATADGRFELAVLGSDRPDMQVKVTGGATFTGGNIYNNDASGQALPNGPAIYVLRLQNDDTVAVSFTVTSTAGDANWQIKYFDAETGGTEITTDVTGAGYSVVGLASGATKDLRVEIKYVGTTAGATKDILVTGASTTDVLKTDVVKATTLTLDHYDLTTSPATLEEDNPTTVTMTAKDSANNTLLTYDTVGGVTLSQNGSGAAADVVWGGAGVTDTGTTGTLASGRFSIGVATVALTYFVPASNVVITATDSNLNKSGSTTTGTNVTWTEKDLTGPVVTVNGTTPSSGSFSPDGDTVDDTITFLVSVSDAMNGILNWDLRIYKDTAKTQLVKTLSGIGVPASNPVWDGMDNAGVQVANGTYTYVFTSTDTQNNANSTSDKTVQVAASPLKSSSPSATAGNTSQVAVDGNGALHVVYASGSQGEIFYAKSLDNGATWTGPVNLSNTSADSKNPSLAVDASGNLYVAWQEAQPGNFDIFYTRWNGTAWSAPGNVSNNSGSSQNPSIVVAGTTPHVAWDDNTSGNSEIYYSKNTGAWTAQENVSSNGTESTQPSMTVDTAGALHVVWEDKPSSNPDVYYSVKTTGAWGPAQNISNTTNSSLNPRIVSIGSSELIAVWEEAVTSSNSDVFYARKVSTWTGSAAVNSTSSQSTNPALSVDGQGIVYLVWQETSGGEKLFFSKFYTGWSGRMEITQAGTDAKYPNVEANAQSSGLTLLWTKANTAAPFDIKQTKVSLGGTDVVQSPNPLVSGISMISVPFYPDSKSAAWVFGQLPSFGTSSFNLARYDPATSGYAIYNSDPANALLNFEPGRGFWVKLDQNFTPTILGTNVNSGTPFNISLVSGWNQIGNPFNFDVMWQDGSNCGQSAQTGVCVKNGSEFKTLSAAKESGWISQYLWSKSGNTYTLVYPLKPSFIFPGKAVDITDRLQSWKGYWLFAGSGCSSCELWIPPVKAPFVKAREHEGDPDVENWTWALLAETDDAKDGVTAGVLKSQAFDSLLKTPSEPSPYVRVSLLRGSSLYQSLFDETPAELMAWDVLVETDEEDKAITLKWDFSGALKEFKFYLHDIDGKTKVDMREVTSYTFNSGKEKVHRFQVELQAPGLFAKIVEVFNYPNPFSLSTGTSIRVQLLSPAAYVKAEIFTLSGKKLRTLYEFGVTGFNRYELKWDGRDSGGRPVANGVYIYRVEVMDTAGRTSYFKGKMAVIK